MKELWTNEAIWEQNQRSNVLCVHVVVVLSVCESYCELGKNTRSLRFVGGEAVKLISVHIQLPHLSHEFGIRISKRRCDWIEVKKVRNVSRLSPPTFSQSPILCVASLRAIILYTLSLKLLSEVSRSAVSLSSSMLLLSVLATAKDLECFTERESNNGWSNTADTGINKRECCPHSHQWRLEALLWILQLLILRAAALCRYTAFFIMAGSFASISAAQMHSSKNSGQTEDQPNTFTHWSFF